MGRAPQPKEMNRMDRRQIFAIAAIAIPTTSLILRPSMPKAQEATIDGMLAMIRRNDVFFRTTNERIISLDGEPLPTRGSSIFLVPQTIMSRKGSSYAYLEELMPLSFDNWTNDRASQVSGLVASSRGELAETLNSLQERNTEQYDSWLETIGILPQGAFADTIFSGQLLATLVSLAIQEDTTDNFFNRIERLDIWFYPLCW